MTSSTEIEFLSSLLQFGLAAEAVPVVFMVFYILLTVFEELQ